MVEQDAAERAELEALTLAVLAQVTHLAAQEFGRSDFTPQARLLDDLHLDSLELIVLAVGLEDHFRVKLSEHDTVGIATVGDLARLVARRTREPAAAGAAAASADGPAGAGPDGEAL